MSLNQIGVLASFTIIFMFGFGFVFGLSHQDQSLDEGEAKSAMIQEIIGLEIPPEQAKYVNVEVNLTEVVISMEEATISFFGTDK